MIARLAGGAPGRDYSRVAKGDVPSGTLHREVGEMPDFWLPGLPGGSFLMSALPRAIRSQFKERRTSQAARGHYGPPIGHRHRFHQPAGPDYETMLIVVARACCGIPEPIATWRTGFCPSLALKTQPRHGSSTSSEAISTCSGAARTACAPSSVAGRSLNCPPDFVGRRPHDGTCVMLGARQTIRALSPAGSWTVPAASASLDGGLGLVAACIDLRYMLSVLVRFHAARPADGSEAG